MDFDAPVPDNGEADTPDYRLIELLFFGYRDFIGIADAALTAYGYGRAHHRVLHFVHRNRDLTVGELLAILKISKQAAARVIKTLTDDGMIITHPGEDDRRERHLTTTTKGAQLADHLSQLQSERIRSAIADLPADSRDAVERFLMRLVEPAERLEVERLTDKA